MARRRRILRVRVEAQNTLVIDRSPLFGERIARASAITKWIFGIAAIAKLMLDDHDSAEHRN
jgi:hypothetical protein